jgi:hypothetical protein
MCKKLTVVRVILPAILAFATGITGFAQAPQAIPYQGVARNAAGNILASQPIGLLINILDGTSTGTIVYSETQSVTTSTLGLFTVNIGTGTPVTGTLEGVNWGSNAKFIDVQMDAAGGTNYVDMGATQLMSVPYALFAGNGGGNSSGNLPAATATGNTVYWNGSAWVADNTIYNDGTKVGIGNITPNAFFNVAADQTVLFGTDTTSAENKLMWLPSKAAFRAGYYSGSNLDPIGFYSTAMGYSSASGASATAMGVSTASGAASTAMGYSISSGYGSTAMCFSTANANYSTSMGFGTVANSNNETVIGTYNVQSDLNVQGRINRLFEIGNGTNGAPSDAVTVLTNGMVGIGTVNPNALLNVAAGQTVLFGTDTTSAENKLMWLPTKSAFRSGYYAGSAVDPIGYGSTAMGNYCTASGTFSTAMGVGSTASGYASTAMGYGAIAKSANETVIGNRNDTSNTNRLFEIGNGNNAARSNVVTVLNNGMVGIGTVNPNALLNVAAGQNVLFGTDTTSAENKLMWLSTKGAFRAGYYPGSAEDTIGLYSTAMGYHTYAPGTFSTAMGVYSTASGGFSTAMGESYASGGASTAMGVSTASGNLSTAMCRGTASGDSSTAMGSSTASGTGSTAMGYSTAGGDYSTAMGYSATASGNLSTAMGYLVSTNGHRGSFVMGDSDPLSGGTTNVGVDDQLVARFHGGYYLETTSNATRTGVYMNSGDNSWSSISDSTKKENKLAIDGEDLLHKISQFKLGTWNYRGQDPKAFRHYGPMAQDFHNAFGKDALGTIGCDTLINQQDFLGVSFIAIQALEKRTEKIETLQKQNAAQQEQIGQLQQNNVALQQQMQTLLNTVTALNKQVQTLAAKTNNQNAVAVNK